MLFLEVESETDFIFFKKKCFGVDSYAHISVVLQKRLKVRKEGKKKGKQLNW